MTNHHDTRRGPAKVTLSGSGIPPSLEPPSSADGQANWWRPRAFAHALALGNRDPLEFINYRALRSRVCTSQCDYELHERLGSGSFGVVYRGLHRHTGAEAAVKVLRPLDGDEHDTLILKEVKMLENLRGCPHIIRLLDVVKAMTLSDQPQASRSPMDHSSPEAKADLRAQVPGARQLQHSPMPQHDRDPNHRDCMKVMETDRSDDASGRVSHLIFELVHNHKPQSLYPRLTLPRIRVYLRQLLLALLYCHEHGVIHGDVKPNNLVIDDDRATLKLIDFGHSHAYWESMRYSPHMGTVSYRAPELLFGSTRIHYAVDVWAAGWVLMHMLLPHRLMAWRSETNESQIGKLNDKYGDRSLQTLCARYGLRCYRLPSRPSMSWHDYLAARPPQDARGREREAAVLTADALDLLERLLALDPYERITCAEALRHPFLQPISSCLSLSPPPPACP